jgi:hypothetical protein
MKMGESVQEEYIFSDPQIVLRHPRNIYAIVQWLPDNQQVLITQDLNDRRGKNEPVRQSIELYNPETGETKIYAFRYHISEPPFWQPELNAVIYPAMNFLGFENTSKIKFTRQIWVSYGSPDTAQLLADNISQFPLFVEPDSSMMLYLSDKKIFKKDSNLRNLPSIAFDPDQWDYSERRSDIPVEYKSSWRPGTSLIFLYGDGNLRSKGYTFILDSETGQVCELNLGGWALKARWSLDGRYLAIIRTQGYFPISSSDLTVLDTLTGGLYSVDVTPQDAGGRHFVDDFVWAPDNRHLLAIGRLSPLPHASQSDTVQSKLYLVDFIHGQSEDILPAYTFYASELSTNLAWSPDGSKLLVRCPTTNEERVCFVKVQKIRQ